MDKITEIIWFLRTITKFHCLGLTGRGRGQSAPETSNREISVALQGKERGKKRKMEQKRKKIEKGKVET